VIMLAPPRSKVQDNIGLSISEEMKALAKTHKERRHRSKKKKKIKVNYAELLNIKVLKNIRREFVQKGGKHESLTADDFIDVLSEYINRSDVEAIYKKIDVNDDGMVDWEEFTGFLISAEGGGTADTGSRNVVQQFVLQREQEFQTHGAQQHSDLIEHIAYGKYPFPVLVTAGRDGKVLLWNPKSLAYMQSIDYRDKSTVFLDGVTKSMPRADIARMQSRGTNFIVKKNPSYFTAVDILPITGHICVSSADCCVNIYDSPSLELTGSLTSAADLPTTLKAFAVLDKIRCINTQYLAIGNSKGKIIVITLNENFIVASDGPLPKINNQEIWETAVKNKYKWKIHKDWVTQIMYISEINRLVSSSLDGTIVLSTIDTQPSGRVFSGHDSGVRCFGWSNASKIICSAGTDRSVLIWDPYTLQVAHRIESLTSMIVSIQINDLSQQIVIVLEEKIFKAWDSMTYEPLPSSEDPSIQLPRNRISASLWVPETEILYAAGNRVCSFRNANVNHEATADEDDDLCKVLYNRNFYEVVTVTKGGFVNVYFAGDGTPESKFLITNSMHQTGKVESTLSVIDAIFDKAQRRLIVVTNDSNEIQIWNFHSGLCLKSFRPRISHSLSQYPDLFPPDNKTSFNITCLFYEHTVTSSEKINKRMLMFGTNLGVVSVLVELPDDIAEEPSFNLVAQSGTANDNMKIRFPETVDVDIIKSEHNGLKTNSNHGYISNARDVTWLCESLTNHVLVAYRDGTVIDWNIDKGIRNVKIVPSEFLKGVSFMAFRRKFANNTSKEPTTADVNLASPREEQHLTPNFEKLPSQIEELTEDELRSMTEPPKLPDQISGDSNVDGQKIVKSSPIRKPKPNSSNNAVVKKMQPKVRTNGPKRVTTGEASRTLLATYGNHFEKQIAGINCVKICVFYSE
jgi:WD40 repeat protein